MMRTILSIAGALILLSSCVKNNPEPVWLEVSDWTLEANPNLNGEEGELTENITDAWVYIDNKLIGVFEVPFKIPLLVEGNFQLKIYPTVRNNGIHATKKIYPFMEPYIAQENFVSGGTVTANLTTRYYNSVDFKLVSDFEDASPGINSQSASLANLVVSNDPQIIQPFNGNGFGRITLDATDNLWSALSDPMVLPKNQEVYLEIDYYTEIPLVTGLIAYESGNVISHPNVQVNGQDASEIQWKKIYIDLKTIVSGSPAAYEFRHSFDAILPEGETSGVINIDNIKVLHL